MNLQRRNAITIFIRTVWRHTSPLPKDITGKSRKNYRNGNRILQTNSKCVCVTNTVLMDFFSSSIIIAFANVYLSFYVYIYSSMSISLGYMPRLSGIDQLRRWEFVVGAAANRRRSCYRFFCHRWIERTAKAHGRSVSATATAGRYNRFGGWRCQDVSEDGGRSHRCCRRGQPTWYEFECVFEYHHAISYSSGK